MIIKPTPQHLHICIDEAGRGPLAGPVCVGAVASLAGFDRSLFRDSKELSPKKRDTLLQQIYQLEENNLLVSGRGMSSSNDIDQYGIINSLQIATCRAIFSLLKKFYLNQRRDILSSSTFGEDILAVIILDKAFRKRKITPQLIDMIMSTPNNYYHITQLIIDGNHTFGLDSYLATSIQTIIKGDKKNPLISIASIVAKVTRDQYMEEVANYLPLYQFEKHKGYGTKTHYELINTHGMSALHRTTFCHTTKKKLKNNLLPKKFFSNYKSPAHTNLSYLSSQEKPKLLLHICCAPDLSWPLHRLKQYFHLQLFWYNPNIHPRNEHTKRYEQFIKLIGLEKGEYTILEDRYDPKEFFQAMYDERVSINKNLQQSDKTQVLKIAGEMEERSDRCNPCYSMRLAQAAKIAAQNNIPYFSSTLLISPKKKMDKLFRRGIDSEQKNPGTKFLRFDFAKNNGYHKANYLTKKHGLRRQNYCGCGRTIPKPGTTITNYQSG